MRRSFESLERRDLLKGEPPPAAAPGEDLLPDMLPWVSMENSYMYGSYIDARIPGRRLLRFSTAVANDGTGPMELHGGEVLPGGSQEVHQRIYKEGGGFTDHLAGTFTYHDEHSHIHFDDYAVYNLRERLAGDEVGEVVASGGKVSFCLLDVADYRPEEPNPEQYDSCNQVQGISVGWADVYTASLDDQWIDVTDVAPGAYWLEASIDPENRLIESDETNNIARVPVVLTAPDGGDGYEPNDSFAAAADLGLAGTISALGLSIHESGDQDFYRFTAAAAGPIDVTVAFEHDDGDIDIVLFDAAFDEVAESGDSEDVEHLAVTANAGDVFYLQVFGYSGSTNPDYRISINGPASVGAIGGTVWDDANGNGTREQGEAGLPGRVVYVDLDENGQFDSAPPDVLSHAAHDLPQPILDLTTTESHLHFEGLSRPIGSLIGGERGGRGGEGEERAKETEHFHGVAKRGLIPG